jgi:hypothetical protein
MRGFASPIYFNDTQEVLRRLLSRAVQHFLLFHHRCDLDWWLMMLTYSLPNWKPSRHEGVRVGHGFEGIHGSMRHFWEPISQSADVEEEWQVGLLDFLLQVGSYTIWSMFHQLFSLPSDIVTTVFFWVKPNNPCMWQSRPPTRVSQLDMLGSFWPKLAIWATKCQLTILES